ENNVWLEVKCSDCAPSKIPELAANTCHSSTERRPKMNADWWATRTGTERAFNHLPVFLNKAGREWHLGGVAASAHPKNIHIRWFITKVSLNFSLGSC
uniref:Uncharacterized protein n=1 Tax=Oryzias latipes TaxID=8090 RepID=A0A3P9I6W6_ORYLA